MKSKTLSLSSYFMLLMLSSLSGCLGDGADPLPDLYEVTGVITLNGQPLGNAKVVFEPEEVREQARRRASSATTNADGSYRLYYNPKAAGATSGKHTVTIFKLPGDSAEASDELSIPAKYNEKTELTADVTEGDNTINFDLKSN